MTSYFFFIRTICILCHSSSDYLRNSSIMSFIMNMKYIYKMTFKKLRREISKQVFKKTVRESNVDYIC